ncbi:MAG: hypothetical protein M3R26_00495 [Actinomycetota bacterium]|nr:hypothetical protein [Actinomycetota bacterium]
MGGSAGALRTAAAGVAVFVALAVMLLTLRLVRGRIAAVAAGVLFSTVGSSPFLESFTLSGELLAALPAVLSLLAFVGYLRRPRGSAGLPWLVAGGLLTGCAFMVRQSAVDAGVAAVAHLLWRERRRALVPVGILVAAAALPVAIGALTAASFHDWWFAVVGYRGHDSLLTGSASEHLRLFWQSAPAALKGLGLLGLLAAIGWGGSPLLVRLWLGAAALGVLGGGSFHAHYYLQLVPPLSVLGGLGVRRLMEQRLVVARAAAAAVSIATVAVTAPLWFDGPEAQARAIWPHDRHLLHDGAVARYVQAHTRPSDRIYVVWAAANLYYLADRDPSFRYLWRRNVEKIPSALADVRRMLERQRPVLVIAAQKPSVVDHSGRTDEILRRRYRLVARIEGVPVYRRRSNPRNTSAVTSNSSAP